MSNTVTGAGRRKYAAQQAKHSQRNDLPAKTGEPRYSHEQHSDDLRKAAGRPKRTDVITAPIAPATTKPSKFADAAEEAGWHAERIRGEDGLKTVRASRGDEVLILSWRNEQKALPWIHSINGVDTKFVHVSVAERWLRRSPEDAAEAAAATAAKKSAPRNAGASSATPRQRKRRVPFDPKTVTPEEVLQAVAGHKLVWYNSMTEDYEEGRVPAEGRTKQRRGPDGQLVDVPIRSQTSVTPSDAEATRGRLVLSFCDPHLGYRACFVDAIQQVGGR